MFGWWWGQMGDDDIFQCFAHLMGFLRLLWWGLLVIGLSKLFKTVIHLKLKKIGSFSLIDGWLCWIVSETK